MAAQAAKVTVLRAASAASALRRPLIPAVSALSLPQGLALVVVVVATLAAQAALVVFMAQVVALARLVVLARKASLSSKICRTPRP